MKYILNHLFILAFLLGLSVSSDAQFVTITDTNFLKVLKANYPNAISGIQLDTTHSSIVNETTLNCDFKFIHQIDGIEYFDNLQTLECSRNLLHSIKRLPPNLISLNCSYNRIDSLPLLPQTLKMLNASFNNMVSLPSFPNSLTTVNSASNRLTTLSTLNNVQDIDISRNSITTLPTLPSTLLKLNCQSNKLSSIPTLPALLNTLKVSFNPIYTLPVMPSSLSELRCESDSITFLPTLPPLLKTLVCNGNKIDTLPILPSGLIHLECGINSLDHLPNLPNTLQILYCHKNVITSLPSLPLSLQHLNCDNNLLISLPTLPPSLLGLVCSNNNIPALPTLPSLLTTLDYSQNPITSLPLLPSGLTHLYWNNNATNILPVLSASLTHLYCNYSTIDSLPILPSGLTYLQCCNDQLTFLPSLPSSLNSLNFNNNLISNFPSLPSNLYELFCANNLISTIPYLPMSLKILDCSKNSNLACLPKIPSNVNWVYLESTPINCLPNFIVVSDTSRTSPSIFSMPLCTPASGCPCAWNITGNVHNNISASCVLDSLNPGTRARKLKMLLYKNSTLMDQIFLTAEGEYSFDTSDDDTLDVTFNTGDLPFEITCPGTGAHHVFITPSDSLKTDINFAVECKGVDAGVGSIQGRFRPGVTTRLAIQAGSMSKFYNVECPYSYSATVTTVLEGPVSFVMPSDQALTPNSVVGNIITYEILDMSTIDVLNAFNIEVYTDSNAQLGSPVCITTTISNVMADTILSNNEFKNCIQVVNSLDPNAKYVSPSENAMAGDKLTYTIHFQNTGNDTAYRVIVKDTLSKNLDISTFQYLASSHNASIDIKDNIVTFYFHKINLLDSMHHEPESHGWIQFSIQLKNNLPFGTKTENIAAIYFDFNSPIFTNMATNYIGPDLTYAAPSNPIKLPNAISPNSDGLNDTWHVINHDYLLEKQLKIEKVIVMNRWGQTVYSSFGDSFRWRPSMAENADVYTYNIIYSTRSGNVRNQHGEIVVVH